MIAPINVERIERFLFAYKAHLSGEALPRNDDLLEAGDYGSYRLSGMYTNAQVLVVFTLPQPLKEETKLIRLQGRTSHI